MVDIITLSMGSGTHNGKMLDLGLLEIGMATTLISNHASSYPYTFSNPAGQS